MRNRRHGYVIVELLLAMSSLFIILGICLMMMHGLLKLDRGGRNHLAEATTRDRLARRFRQDVRAASEAKPTPGGDRDAVADHLELSFPDGRGIEYRVLNDRIERAEHDRQGSVLSHDRFVLPSRARPWFQARQERRSVLLSLELRTKTVLGDESSAPHLRVEALLGKDLRFADAGTQGAAR